MRASASKSALLSNCRYPFQDGVILLPEENLYRDAAAKRGTAVGQRATRFINGKVRGEVLPLDEMGEKMWAHLAKWLDENVSNVSSYYWTAEAAYGLRPSALGAEVAPLGHDIGREYPPDVFGGSVDILHVGERGGVVYDVKCGKKVDHYWPQLRSLGAMVMVHHDLQEPINLVILHTRPEGLTPLKRTLTRQTADVVIAQLCAWLAEEEPEPIPGAWCKDLYCDHRPMCGAYREVAA